MKLTIWLLSGFGNAVEVPLPAQVANPWADSKGDHHGEVTYFDGKGGACGFKMEDPKKKQWCAMSPHDGMGGWKSHLCKKKIKGWNSKGSFECMGGWKSHLCKKKIKGWNSK